MLTALGAPRVQTSNACSEEYDRIGYCKLPSECGCGAVVILSLYYVLFTYGGANGMQAYVLFAFGGVNGTRR